MTSDDKQKKYSSRGHSGAAPDADFYESVRQFWAGLPKYPLDMAQNLSGTGNRKLLDDTTTLASRMMEFGQARIQADMSFMTALAQCKQPEDVLSLQKDWFETAVRDYRETNAELVKAGMQLFSDGVEAAEDVSEEKAAPKK
ncbi:MAG: phasin family protein [Alphaproteobacteria bacterium]